jgi:hypothetical protein
MSDTDRTGALFRNHRKAAPNHPDFNGEITIDGVRWRLAAWWRETKDGRPYMSLGVRPDTAAGARQRRGGR